MYIGFFSMNYLGKLTESQTFVQSFFYLNINRIDISVTLYRIITLLRKGLVFHHCFYSNLHLDFCYGLKISMFY